MHAYAHVLMLQQEETMAIEDHIPKILLGFLLVCLVLIALFCQFLFSLPLPLPLAMIHN